GSRTRPTSVPPPTSLAPFWPPPVWRAVSAGDPQNPPPIGRICHDRKVRPTRDGSARAELFELAFDVLPVEDLAARLLLGVVPAEEDHRDHGPEIEAADDLHDESRHLHVGQGRDPVQTGHVLIE